MNLFFATTAPPESLVRPRAGLDLQQRIQFTPQSLDARAIGRMWPTGERQLTRWTSRTVERAGYLGSFGEPFAQFVRIRAGPPGFGFLGWHSDVPGSARDASRVDRRSGKCVAEVCSRELTVFAAEVWPEQDLWLPIGRSAAPASAP